MYSTTLDRPVTARTRIERSFDPDAVRDLKASADRDLEIGGPQLAGEALRAGLVDEVSMVLAPVVVGGGKPALPDGVRPGLKLVDQRRFLERHGVPGLPGHRPRSSENSMIWVSRTLLPDGPGTRCRCRRAARWAGR